MKSIVNRIKKAFSPKQNTKDGWPASYSFTLTKEDVTFAFDSIRKTSVLPSTILVSKDLWQDISDQDKQDE